MQQAKIGIIGATGYVGLELVRLLASHPGFRLTRLGSQSQVGKRFSEIHPAFASRVDLELTATDPDDLAQACDFVITALPHGVSAGLVPQLLERNLRVLDHSGDFRYRDVAVYEQAYKLKHPHPELLAEAVYGLPELYRQPIASARLVANPGCYPTCALLALLPLLRHRAIRLESIIIDAISGVSGAGRKADLAYSYCETTENFRPYGVVGHRHTSEIEQEIGLAAGLNGPIPVSFTPHLAPLRRGMLATVYADLAPGFDPDQIRSLYEQIYQDEPFIRLMPAGQMPETRNIAGSNFADIGLALDPRTKRIKVFSAIDNLGKGAAAQAIQALNVMAGWPETTGLTGVPQAL